jgi:hypothetical protein
MDMTEQVDIIEQTKEVESFCGKIPIDLKRVRKTYADLIGDKTHAAPCTCPSCEYQLHKTKGGNFDKEVFFLDWLSLEVKLSLINQTEKIVFETAYGRGKNTMSVEWRDFFKRWGTIQALADFVNNNFPDIDPSPRRIKLKLWRFRKSGIGASLEKEIILNGIKANPVDPKINKTRQALRLAQRVADYIYKRRDHAFTQRDLRRFFQKPVEELIDLRPWLDLNYGIVCKQGKRENQIVYTGTMKSGRGRFLRVGIHDTK